MKAVRLLLLNVWVVLALLGHSGTHALADWLGVCCHVVPAVTKPGVGSHVGCACHAHRTSSPAGSESCPKVPADHRSGDTHDPENCRLCDWFLKFQPQAVSLVSVSFLYAVDWVPAWVDAEVAPQQICSPSSRGPPPIC